MTTSITIRAVELQQVGVLVKLGDQIATVETEPRRRWAVTIDHGHTAEIAALFDAEDKATEAAQALERQLRAELGTDGEGLKLTTRDAVTIQ